MAREIIDSVEKLEAELDRVRAAQREFATYTQEQVDKIFFAAAMAANLRMDNRILFSAGRAAINLKLLGDGVGQVFALPLSVSGKSVFFDRKPKK